MMMIARDELSDKLYEQERARQGWLLFYFGLATAFALALLTLDRWIETGVLCIPDVVTLVYALFVAALAHPLDRIEASGRAGILGVLLLMPTVIYMVGGVNTPAMIWFVILPSLIAQIFDKKTFVAVTLVMIAEVAAMFVLNHYGIRMPNPDSVVNSDILRRLVPVILTVFAAIVTAVYESKRQYDLEQAERLRNLLAVCAWCGRVKDDRSVWRDLEEHLETYFDEWER